MNASKFEELYKRLNPEQKIAVDTIEGPVMVVAGPGTGKTQILTLRIANILQKTQVNPENILALTFTEAAKTEMRQRLVDIIGTPAFKVGINTFHGFCNEIIKEYLEDFPYLISAVSIIDTDQIKLLEDIISHLTLKYLKPFGDPLYYLKPALSEISNLKKEGVGPEELSNALEQWQEEFNATPDLYHDKGKYKGEMKGKYQDWQKNIFKTRELLVIFKAYQEKLNEQRKYDFNDMLLEVKKALEINKSLLLRLQEKYQYFLIDEHQDTNAAQNKIIELLGDFFDNPNIFVVGDEKQAIFRFQGASLENFLYFQKIYPKAKLINLSENYRSHQKILDAADNLITNNITANLLSAEKINLSAQKKEGEAIKLVILNDYFAEYEFIADDIKKKVEEGTKFSEIAVIARNNKDLNEAVETFERKGIPYFVNSDQNVLQDLYIQKLILILKAVNDVGSEPDLLKAMHIGLFNIEPFDIYKLIVSARKENATVYEILMNIKDKPSKKISLSNLKNVTAFYQLLTSWQKAVNNQSLEQIFTTIIKESGLREAILTNPKRYELLDKLTALFEELKSLIVNDPQFNLSDFLNYLQLCREHELSLKSHARTITQDAVQLMTAHRSKGLEFDYVYIINAYDGHWGNSKKRSNGFNIPWHILGIKLNLESTENEDERRLFYVAMTRAKKDITITYCTHSLEGNEKVPSQFISEIDEQLIKKINTKEFEDNFMVSKEVILDAKQMPIISAKNKEFFRKIFLNKGLSATALDNYLKCPWQFFYRNLLQFPEAKENYLIFGTAVHHALDAYIRQRQSKTLTANFLLEKFNESIQKAAVSKEDKQILMEKGRRSLVGYFENVIPAWGGDIQSELTIKGVKLREGVVINGRLDMIEILDGGRVAVHDFKSGRVKSRSQIDGSNEKSDYHYLQQLVFYKILLNNYKNGLMKMTQGVIDFIEPDEKGRFKSEKFEITETMAKNLEDKIIFIANEILNIEFWDKRCDNLKCEYCQLRNLTMKE